jgi:hypothetical protein
MTDSASLTDLRARRTISVVRAVTTRAGSLHVRAPIVKVRGISRWRCQTGRNPGCVRHLRGCGGAYPSRRPAENQIRGASPATIPSNRPWSDPIPHSVGGVNQPRPGRSGTHSDRSEGLHASRATLHLPDCAFRRTRMLRCATRSYWHC